MNHEYSDHEKEYFYNGEWVKVFNFDFYKNEVITHIYGDGILRFTDRTFYRIEIIKNMIGSFYINKMYMLSYIVWKKKGFRK